MTAHVTITCDCEPLCGECVDGLSVQHARDVASRSGWDRDTVNGTTVDFAPGHSPDRRAA